MSSPVPRQRTRPAYSEVAIAAPVRERLWRDTGLLYHWLRAHGQQLVPAHSPRIRVSAGSARVLRYHVHPRPGQAIARVWYVVLRRETETPASSWYADITFPDGATRRVRPEWAEYVGDDPLRGELYVEELAAKVSGLTELALTVAATGTDTWVESACCYELPRVRLNQDDGDDFGIEIESLRAGQRIYYDGAGVRSIGVLARALAGVEVPRELVQLAFPTVSTNSTTGVNLWTLALPILPSKFGRSDTTRACEWEIYARVTASDTKGTITLSTSLAGGNATITIDGAVAGGTSFAWRTGPTIAAACESMASADGRPAGGWETVQALIKRTSGTGKIELQSFAMREASKV